MEGEPSLPEATPLVDGQAVGLTAAPGPAPGPLPPHLTHFCVFFTHTARGRVHVAEASLIESE